jgi:hypothetical protein
VLLAVVDDPAVSDPLKSAVVLLDVYYVPELVPFPAFTDVPVPVPVPTVSEAASAVVLSAVPVEFEPVELNELVFSEPAVSDDPVELVEFVLEDTPAPVDYMCLLNLIEFI